MRIHPETRIGAVHYTVRDLNRQVDFYRDILGFHLLWCDGDTAALGTKTRELLRLTENPSAPAPGRTTGLYHTAFLVPTKWELAHLVNRVIETRTPVQGHSNHGTHLALYLPDPEGNGIELAWDFPKEQWPMKDGVIRFEDMPREGIDLEALLSELDKDPSPWNGLSDETVVGHVHLHVSHLDETRAFYRDLLGFDITIEGEHLGALFFSAGGYHHHIGTNVWRGVGIPAPPEGARGLRYFTIVLPHGGELERLAARLQQAGVQAQTSEDCQQGLVVRDPAGNGVLLQAA